MGVDYDLIVSIIQDVSRALKPGDIISAKKVYADYESSLNRAGIKSFDILYRIIDLMEGLPLSTSRIPHLIRTGADEKSISVRDAIRAYIVDKAMPCSIEKIYEVFVTERGITKNALAPSLFLGNGILEISDGTFIDEKLLGLSPALLSELDVSLAALFGKYIEQSGLFYQLSLVDEHYELLPPLGNCRWSKQLLRFALKRSSRYRCVGQHKNCIVDTYKHPDIQNDEDFYAAIITDQFTGWSTFDDFVSYCSLYGIADDLGSEYFDAFEKIEASDYSIRLEEH
jgi:hypothetical protein